MNDLVSFRDVARQIGVSLSALSEMAYKGLFEFVRDSAGWRFVRRDIVERLREQVASGELPIDHARRRLSDKQVKELLELYQGGVSQLDLSLRFGVDLSTVHRLVHRERRTKVSEKFRHLKPRQRGMARPA